MGANPSSSADDHGCTQVTCTGFPCGTNQACKSYASGLYACFAKPCSTDGDCDCGVCVLATTTTKGSCAGRLNICVRGAGGAQGPAGGALGAGGVSGSGGTTGAGGAIDGSIGIDSANHIDGA